MKDVLQEYLDTHTPEELRAEIAKREPLNPLPWYKKDKDGWPIEGFVGKPIKSFIRLVCQNIRKVTG